MRENYLSWLLMLRQWQLMCFICKTPRIISHLACYLSSKDLISIDCERLAITPIQLLTTCADRARSRSLTLANHFDIWSSIMKFLQLHRFVISARLNTYTSFVGGYVRLLLSFPFNIPFHNGVYSFWPEVCNALNQPSIFKNIWILCNNIHIIILYIWW